MTNARVVIDVPCPDCDETGKRYTGGSIDRFNARVSIGPCDTCHGTGTVPRVVTCGGCRWWRSTFTTELGECETHLFRTARTFGCSLWESLP